MNASEMAPLLMLLLGLGFLNLAFRGLISKKEGGTTVESLFATCFDSLSRRRETAASVTPF